MAARLSATLSTVGEKELSVGGARVSARTSKRYPLEFIRGFIQLVHGGISLSDASRQKGIRKSTGKYWLDNADKFLPKGDKSVAVAGNRLQDRYLRETWKLRFKALKAAEQKLKETDAITLKDIVALLAELREGGTQPALVGSGETLGQLSAEYTEKHAKIKMDVSNFLKKSVKETTDAVAEQGAEKNLTAPPVERGSEGDEEMVISDEKTEEEERNGANS